MDYILFGMGFGASLMLVGWALRTFGPAWKYAATSRDDAPDLAVARRFWIRFVQGLGGVFAIGGTAMVLLTFFVMLVNPDDATGQLFAWLVWLSIAASIGGWSVLYVRRYGTTGIWSRSDGYGFRSSRRSASGSQDSALRSFQSQPPSQDPPTTATGLISATDEPQIAADNEASSPNVLNSAGVDAEIPAPEYDFGDGSDTTVPGSESSRDDAEPRSGQQEALSSDEPHRPLISGRDSR